MIDVQAVNTKKKKKQKNKKKKNSEIDLGVISIGGFIIGNDQ